MNLKNLPPVFYLSAFLLSGICGVYTKTACAQSWEIVRNLPARAFAIDQTEHEENDAREENEKKVPAITITNDFIALGTENGVLISRDDGNHWEQLPTSGLKDMHVFDLAYSAQSKSFFAATKKGVYVYEPAQKHWKELYEGLPAVSVNRLEIFPENPEILYAVTDQGVYRLTIGPEFKGAEIIQNINADRWALFCDLMHLEPSVGTIQKQTIRYANVGNGKIKKWHRGSRLRALVPTFSIGKNYSRSDNVDIDRGGTSDADQYIMGPQNQNQSWDMDLNWDIADLIWNSAETSIDSREKLMVELRNDILTEATRLYFERRRAQIELIQNRPEEIDRLQAALRLDELTASIDALTDGFLTHELERLYTLRPEFRALWENDEL